MSGRSCLSDSVGLRGVKHKGGDRGPHVGTTDVPSSVHGHCPQPSRPRSSRSTVFPACRKEEAKPRAFRQRFRKQRTQSVGRELTSELESVPCESDLHCVTAQFHVAIMVTGRHLPRPPPRARVSTTVRPQEVTPHAHLRVRRGLALISGYACPRDLGVTSELRSPTLFRTRTRGNQPWRKMSLGRRFGPRKSLSSSALYGQFTCSMLITK